MPPPANWSISRVEWLSARSPWSPYNPSRTYNHLQRHSLWHDQVTASSCYKFESLMVSCRMHTASQGLSKVINIVSSYNSSSTVPTSLVICVFKMISHSTEYLNGYVCICIQARESVMQLLSTATTTIPRRDIEASTYLNWAQ